MSGELEDVYEHIIKNIIETQNRPRTFHMMQWICLANRPLSITELRFAIASDCLHTDELQQFCKDARDFVETDERMEKLVTTLSGGLAEVKHHEKYTTIQEAIIVQFIHQSVNDFLLLNGLRYLASVSPRDISTQDSGPWTNLSNDDILGQSQHRLFKSCVSYLRLEEVMLINTQDPVLIQKRLSFIYYATRF